MAWKHVQVAAAVLSRAQLWIKISFAQEIGTWNFTVASLRSAHCIKYLLRRRVELVYTNSEHAQYALLKSLLRRRVELVYTIREHAQSELLKSLLRRCVELVFTIREHA